MAGAKIGKVVLDADVIIHFAKAGRLPDLPSILPEFDFLLLDIVKNELSEMILSIVKNMITRDKSLSEVRFGDSDGEKREFARLTSMNGMALGRGESACMVYCKYHSDVLGSSNLKDIREYCKEQGITYLTTIDFLFFAIRRGILTKQEATDFIKTVVDSGSHLPEVDFEKYICTKI